MKKVLTIGLAAAMTAALSLMAVGGTERAAVADADASTMPYYERGPRIIHVPQPNERQQRRNEWQNGRAGVSANARTSVNRPAVVDRPHQEEVDFAPAPGRRTLASKHRADVVPPIPRKPRWGRYDDPLPGQRRAVLSAPPPLTAGPTPIRPTPRFEAKIEAAEKFSPPRSSAVTSNPPSSVYTPPAKAPVPKAGLEPNVEPEPAQSEPAGNPADQ